MHKIRCDYRKCIRFLRGNRESLRPAWHELLSCHKEEGSRTIIICTASQLFYDFFWRILRRRWCEGGGGAANKAKVLAHRILFTPFAASLRRRSPCVCRDAIPMLKKSLHANWWPPDQVLSNFFFSHEYCAAPREVQLLIMLLQLNNMHTLRFSSKCKSRVNWTGGGGGGEEDALQLYKYLRGTLNSVCVLSQLWH